MSWLPAAGNWSRMILREALARGIILLLPLASVFFLAGCEAQPQSSAPAKTAAKVEKTLAEELLELEGQHRDLPPEYFELLQSVMNESVAALGDKPVQPKTPAEAIAASEAVSLVFAKHNFFQPTGFQTNPSTLGEALTPKSLSEDELKSLLEFLTNPIRVQYYTPGQPVYLVDCDMASLILMSVFDRIGWDTRLAKAPVHMFLRWHLPDGETVNWDWSSWGSFDDELYLLARGETAREQVKQGTYLRSLPKEEAKGGFIGLIGSLLDDENTELDDNSAAIALLENAIELAPNHPSTLNNLAWVYATDPGLALEYGEVAIMYAHRAVAADTSRFFRFRIGTLACAYAADSEWTLADAIMTGLVEENHSTGAEAYEYNLNRIKNKKLCGD